MNAVQDDKKVKKFLDIERKINWCFENGRYYVGVLKRLKVSMTRGSCDEKLIRYAKKIEKFQRKLGITICIIAPAFTVKPPDFQIMRDIHDEDFEAIFTLTPKETGKQTIRILILRSADLIFSVSKNVFVRENRKK